MARDTMALARGAKAMGTSHVIAPRRRAAQTPISACSVAVPGTLPGITSSRVGRDSRTVKARERMEGNGKDKGR